MRNEFEGTKMDKRFKKIKIGDLVLFKVKYKDLDTEYCIGFIQAMNNKYFTISAYAERITFLWIPQFESLVHYKDIKGFTIFDKPSNLLKPTKSRSHN